MKMIQNFVQQVIETMATILEVEITIVDSAGERIAGTGSFASKIGAKIPPSYILSKVITEGNHCIVDDPGKNILCKHCNALMDERW